MWNAISYTVLVLTTDVFFVDQIMIWFAIQVMNKGVVAKTNIFSKLSEALRATSELDSQVARPRDEKIRTISLSYKTEMRNLVMKSGENEMLGYHLP